MRDALRILQAGICRFWGTVPGALKNHLNTEELARITIASLTAGGGLFGLVEALSMNVGSIFPASGDAALATVVLTMILEGHRRLHQGQDPRHLPQPPRPNRYQPRGTVN